MLIESELDNNPLIADLDHDMQLLLDKVQNIP